MTHTMKPLESDDPRRVGSYRLVAALGSGGMGRALLGIAPDGRLAAVKQIRPELGRDPGFRNRFRQETENSRRVSGAYTAAVLDADPDADPPWLATLFISGPTLRQAVEQAGPLPSYAVRHLAVGLAAALADIHRAGLVHRDLKPGNVLLVDDGPRVIDFGIAKAIEDGPALTRTGSIIGSPAFMSPEQAEGLPLTFASDIFSLGSLLVMATTGHGPFTGDSTPQTLYNIVHTEPNLALVPPELLDLIEPCLAKNPAMRPTPVAILDHIKDNVGLTWPPALRMLIRQRQQQVRDLLSLPEIPAPPERPKTRRKRHLRTGAIVAGAIAGITAGLLTATQSGGGEHAGPGTASPMTLEKALTSEVLRQTNPCALLNGEKTPDGHDVTLESPDFSRYVEDHCAFKSNDLPINLSLTSIEINSATKTAAQLDGLPIEMNRSEKCDAGLNSPEVDTDHPQRAQWGLKISVDGLGENACAVAQDLLVKAAKRLQSGGYQYDYDTAWPLHEPPCKALDLPRAEQIVGAATSSSADIHSCTWRSNDDTRKSTLTISFSTTHPVTHRTPALATPYEFHGITAYREDTGGSDVCVLRLPYGPALSPDMVEEVYAQYDGTEDYAKLCSKAADALRGVLTQFPPPQ